MDNNFFKPSQETNNNERESDLFDYGMDQFSINFLKSNKIIKLEELSNITKEEFYKFPNINSSYIRKIKVIMEENGIEFKN
jgi:DNA-directed RNA polymerase alpha subunit